MTRNKDLHFICKEVSLKIVSNRSNWLNSQRVDDSLVLPIAHGEGRYQCSEETLLKLQDTDAIALKYEKNPKGSLFDIAGITNSSGNVLGLMPHPERACDPSLGGVDGRKILESLLG